MISVHHIQKQGDLPGLLATVRAGGESLARALESATRVIEAVKDGGDSAVLEMTLRFDGVSMGPGELEVPGGDRREAWEDLGEVTRGALEKAASRIAAFARLGLAGDWREEMAPGVVAGQLSRPLERVGVYVPGGRFAYPSTVLMTGILAREAGVGEILYCVPPGDEGAENQVSLAATTLVEGCRVFRVGGAQAVAAMACGTETIPRCSMITGPGNVYVTAAKRLVSNEVKTDLEAGPSEVAILADGSCPVSFAVADMAAQLEHDPMALAVLVSESPRVLSEAGELAARAPGETVKGEGGRGTMRLVSCDSRELSVEFLNALAPEHLALMVRDPEETLEHITSAGAVFLGPWSAVALGDYVTGPSHVLPTGGTAARLSGLRAQDFRRIMNVVEYTREGFEGDCGTAKLLAGLEGLAQHVASLEVRRHSGGEDGA